MTPARTLTIAGAIVMGACAADASGEPSLDDHLQGVWISETPGPFSCYTGLAFEAPTLEIDLICALDSGATGLQADLFDYELDGERLDVTPVATTCDAEPNPQTFGVELLPSGLLRVTNASSVATFERVDRSDDSGGGTGARFGCFADDGAFTPGEVRPL